jgi:hypothetical protein
MSGVIAPTLEVTAEDKEHALAILRGMKASDPVARIGDQILMAGEAIMSVERGTKVGLTLIERFVGMRDKRV